MADAKSICCKLYLFYILFHIWPESEHSIKQPRGGKTARLFFMIDRGIFSVQPEALAAKGVQICIAYIQCYIPSA